jgi:ribonuclease P protein component
VRYPSTYFVAFCLRHSSVDPDSAPRESGPRFGITIPRAVGKAVIRNKIRRRLRELLRARLDRVSPNCDIVFNPRRSALLADFAVLAREMDKVLARCNA